MNTNPFAYRCTRVGQKISRRKLLHTLTVGGAGLALASCTGARPTPPMTTPTPTAGAVSTPVARPKLGGAITTMVTLTEQNLEPHGGTGGPAVGVGAGICYSNLLTYKWGPDIKPPSYIPTGDLAESWEQPDDLTYLFKLRPGIRWHNIPPVNGRELTADDVIYTYQRVREKRTYAAFLAGISKMEAVDRATLKLTLDKPNADLLNNLAQPNLMVVARERVEQTGGNLDEPPLIGTGPFLLDTFEPRQRTVAKRNPDYFLKGQPYFDTFTSLQVGGDPSLMVSAFRTGAANVLGSGLTHQMAEDIKRAMPSATITYIPADRILTDFILNTSHEIFQDIRVRQALSKAIDRKAIIDTLWQGRGRPMAGLSLPDPSYNLPEAELSRLVARDIGGARRLLQEAARENLSFEIVTSNVFAGTMITIAELIQANLREIGVTTNIRVVDSPTLTAALQSGNFQAVAYITSTSAPNGLLYARHYTAGPQNYAKFSDPAMDQLIDQQAVMSRDPEGRKKILQDIQRKIIDSAVYIPLAFFDQPIAYAAEVKGLHPPAILNLHNAFWITVWLDK